MYTFIECRTSVKEKSFPIERNQCVIHQQQLHIERFSIVVNGVFVVSVPHYPTIQCVVPLNTEFPVSPKCFTILRQWSRISHLICSHIQETTCLRFQVLKCQCPSPNLEACSPIAANVRVQGFLISSFIDVHVVEHIHKDDPIAEFFRFDVRMVWRICNALNAGNIYHPSIPNSSLKHVSIRKVATWHFHCSIASLGVWIDPKHNTESE